MKRGGLFNVVEVIEGSYAGRVVVLPVRRPNFRLPLRRARYRLLCTGFDFADGFACGLLTARRAKEDAQTKT